jgi:cytochrome c oxidase subunit 2
LLIAVLAALAMACGGGGGQPAAGGHDHGAGGHPVNSPVVAGARVVEVTARSFAFEPERIPVRAGEDVMIALRSADTLHDFTLAEGRAHVVADPGAAAQGGLRVDRPGTYTAFCSVAGHREAGMAVEVVAE